MRYILVYTGISKTYTGTYLYIQYSTILYRHILCYCIWWYRMLVQSIWWDRRLVQSLLFVYQGLYCKVFKLYTGISKSYTGIYLYIQYSTILYRVILCYCIWSYRMPLICISGYVRNCFLISFFIRT